MLDNLITKYRDLQAKREDGEGGFTLIELLVVVVIIGILIAIAIPLYLNYQKGAADKSSASDVRGGVSAVNQCAADNANTNPASGTGGTNGTDLVFTCGTSPNTSTQKATVSDGSTLVYQLQSDKTFKLEGHNANGSGKYYMYNSATGKTTTANSAQVTTTTP